MAADAANSESYFLETGTKEKVGMSQSDRLQRSRSLLCSHYLQDALYLYFKKRKIYLLSNQYLKKSKRWDSGRKIWVKAKDHKERLVT